MSKKGSGTKAFRTPSGDVSANARRAAAKKGNALPNGTDPINNVTDLKNAKRSIGRVAPQRRAAARKLINRRAKELGQPPLGASLHPRTR